MKIGYPCINTTIGCTANSTFRLANYSPENLIKKVTNNLECLEKILEFNIQHSLLFFRISSDIIPFAGHPVCTFNWQEYFRQRLVEIGRVIKENNIRISMHPDQFVLINALKEEIVKNSTAELKWHCEMLDLMELESSAKVQIHAGGVYGDKDSAVKRFIDNYINLPEVIKKRLAIENDERLFSLKECLYISEKTGVPVIFDSFHHSCLNNNESMAEALKAAGATWEKTDGILMTDYSSQEPGARTGKHINHIDIDHFKNYIRSAGDYDFDIMLEIKDKEKSALEAVEFVIEQNHHKDK